MVLSTCTVNNCNSKLTEEPLHLFVVLADVISLSTKYAVARHSAIAPPSPTSHVCTVGLFQ